MEIIRVTCLLSAVVWRCCQNSSSCEPGVLSLASCLRNQLLRVPRPQPITLPHNLPLPIRVFKGRNTTPNLLYKFMQVKYELFNSTNLDQRINLQIQYTYCSGMNNFWSSDWPCSNYEHKGFIPRVLVFGIQWPWLYSGRILDPCSWAASSN